MAVNLTRKGTTFKKRSRSIMSVNMADEGLAGALNAADNYLVGYLPEDAVITNAYVFTTVAGALNTVALGTTEGGTEILSAGDAASLGKSGTFTGESGTGSGVPVYMSITAAVDGVFSAVIHYDEVSLNNGDLTRINTIA